MTLDHPSRSGFTLAELMVVITILGVMAAVTGVALATRAPVPATDAMLARVAAARDSAAHTGQPATIEVDVDSTLYLVTAFPDGRVMTDAPLGVSKLSGRNQRADR